MAKRLVPRAGRDPFLTPAAHRDTLPSNADGSNHTDRECKLPGNARACSANRTIFLGNRFAVGASRGRQRGIRSPLLGRRDGRRRRLRISRGVVRLLLREAAILVLAGIGCGALGAVWSANLLRSLAHGIDETSAATFISAAGLLAAAVMLACYLPARRAARPAVRGDQQSAWDDSTRSGTGAILARARSALRRWGCRRIDCSGGVLRNVSLAAAFTLAATSALAQNSADRVWPASSAPLTLAWLDAQVIAMLGDAAGVPTAFESAGRPVHFSGFHPDGKTVAQVLDALTAADPRYAWHDDNGVITVYPRKRSPGQDVLNAPIKGAIKLTDVEPRDVFAVLGRLFSGREGSNPPKDTKRFSFEVAEGSHDPRSAQHNRAYTWSPELGILQRRATHRRSVRSRIPAGWNNS